MTNVLFVVSAADVWTLDDGSVHPTGFWAEELVVPHEIFADAGWQIAIATPGGVMPTVDEKSLSAVGGTAPWKISHVRSYLEDLQPVLKHPLVLGDVDASSYDLVFYPGGHGPMEDLAVDPVSGELLTQRLSSGEPLALLCHGPAAVLATVRNGSTPFAGRKMTAFSNVEEKFNPASRKARWLLEDKLNEIGVQYEKAMLPMVGHVVVDGNLYTGQNPASSKELAERLVEDLDMRLGGVNSSFA